MTDSDAVRRAAVASSRLPGLDGLRAVAVLLVLGVHGWKNAVPGGYVGVDVFFVLSGFLITTLLLREHVRVGISLRRFYARRALRLFPALAAVLIVALVLSVTVLPAADAVQTRTGILWSLGYAGDWARALDPSQNLGALGHTWSLSIEEQFYLLWPLLLILLMRHGSVRSVLCYCAALIALIWVWRVLLEPPRAVQQRAYFALDTRADLLLAGCLIALAETLGWLRAIPRRVLQSMAVAGVAYVVVFALFAPTTPIPGTWSDYLPESVMITLLVASAIAARPAWLIGPLEWRPLAALGVISYGVYLWHYPIWDALSPHLPSGPAMLLVLVPLTFATAALSYRFIEQPALRLKQRIGGQPSPALSLRTPVQQPLERLVPSALAGETLSP